MVLRSYDVGEFVNQVNNEISTLKYPNYLTQNKFTDDVKPARQNPPEIKPIQELIIFLLVSPLNWLADLFVREQIKRFFLLCNLLP